MGKCIYCQKTSPLVSSPLNICVDCIRNHFEEVVPQIKNIHTQVRETFNLPAYPPQTPEGLQCPICSNQCQIPEGGRGYCGVRINQNGRLVGGGVFEGNLSSYHDPLPTNCVAGWICPGGAGCGYPEFSYTQGAEYGYTNLAVFFQSCTFNCLFCQNWHYRQESTRRGNYGPKAIAAQADDKTACICYFGGDPTSQILYALKASKVAREKKEGKILRICWETNGSMHPKLLEKAADLSLQSGGCIKFDLKAWHEEVHLALCGVSNRPTLDNFKRLSEYIPRRPEPPLLVASTLLVPGYIDEEEVNLIAKFIAALNPDIPYSLLGFFPHFYMRDLPTTSRDHAQRSLQVAREAGLTKVKIGNIHLLGDAY